MVDIDKIKIREAVEEDADLIIEHTKKILVETDYHTISSDEFNIKVDEQKKKIKSIDVTDNSLMLVCFLDNELVGVLTLAGGNRARTKHNGQLGINLIERACGYGIGIQLMKEMESWILKNNVITKVSLLVHEENVRAIKFYEKLGYVFEGRSRRFFYKDKVYSDGIYMGKLL